MRWTSTLLSLAAAATVVSAQSPVERPRPVQTYSGVVIYQPPANYTEPRTLYARTLEIKERGRNVLLATWENYLPDNNPNPYYPVYESLDNGKSWKERSRLYDQVNGWGARYQPFIYELPENLGTFKKGDILIAGNFIPQDLSQTKIDIYVSRDKARTWKFVSSVARGGEAIPNNGLTPVWEPFLYLYKKELICYYSDQRDFVNNGQKMVHQTSTDLLNWGELRNDVAYNNTEWRPGMPIVSKLPNGKFLLTYEFFGSVEGGFSVYTRLATDPRNFNEAEGRVLRATDGTVPRGSPYNVWTPVGGPNGTIIVSSGDAPEIFLNKGLAEPGSTWEKVSIPSNTSYTRSLNILKSDPRALLVVGGGLLPGQPGVERNRVDATLWEVPSAPRGYGKRATGFEA
ncbi:Non-structural maintenance of chromosomes element 1 [Sphaceloma murrayae]|uniref:Non-structural maintenance of chromosomes element 1 n=1 Tax=Sphaceloma murrayae TaxID=2082308 RepID=A0A2K1R058_9PEZI|nr:Non-structural maintenance of chromosomes element 1 [Sphaceloma murrayae]